MHPALLTLPIVPATHTSSADLSLELQVLKQSLDDNGACTALNKILDAASINNAATKEGLLKEMIDNINGQSNSVFLDKSVNAEVRACYSFTGPPSSPAYFTQKRLVVQHALGDTSTALEAVKAYLANRTIESAMSALATNLDKLTATMISNAATQANAAINKQPSDSARQRKLITDGP